MVHAVANASFYFGTAGALPYMYELRSPDGGDALFTSSVLAVDADMVLVAEHRHGDLRRRPGRAGSR